MLRTSRRRRQQSDAAKISSNGARTAEIGWHRRFGKLISQTADGRCELQLRTGHVWTVTLEEFQKGRERAREIRAGGRDPNSDMFGLKPPSKKELLIVGATVVELKNGKKLMVVLQENAEAYFGAIQYEELTYVATPNCRSYLARLQRSLNINWADVRGLRETPKRGAGPESTLPSRWSGRVRLGPSEYPRGTPRRGRDVRLGPSEYPRGTPRRGCDLLFGSGRPVVGFGTGRASGSRRGRTASTARAKSKR